MVREILIVVSLIVFAAAFRACRKNWTRKLGALLFLVASFLAFYFFTDCLWAGLLGVVLWFFLPWFELLMRVRHLRLPLQSRLDHHPVLKEEFFPHASQALVAMSEADFDYATDSTWQWAGMEQRIHLHWNPEERAVSALHLCEKDNAAFAFLTITSRTEEGEIYRTTNFPFSCLLKGLPSSHLNHVPCERNCFHQLLADHHKYLERLKVPHEVLASPHPEGLEDEVGKEMKSIVDYNLQIGVIATAGEGSFRYTTRGLFFLWKQFVKDMIRLC